MVILSHTPELSKLTLPNRRYLRHHGVSRANILHRFFRASMDEKRAVIGVIYKGRLVSYIDIYSFDGPLYSKKDAVAAFAALCFKFTLDRSIYRGSPYYLTVEELKSLYISSIVDTEFDFKKTFCYIFGEKYRKYNLSKSTK
ncbi:hypothetical protein [Sigmofec virus UA08Rod_4577]|uniref:Uncharacterized protein n=1 Tax=Sigmofec virus UA08Rod_4577 TaxID=2929404 RepID=A0A976R7S9_9VIRU|nr:hypothetical protein [Sigmofec virus UA08Rod_4577]